MLLRCGLAVLLVLLQPACAADATAPQTLQSLASVLDRESAVMETLAETLRLQAAGMSSSGNEAAAASTAVTGGTRAIRYAEPKTPSSLQAPSAPPPKLVEYLQDKPVNPLQLRGSEGSRGQLLDVIAAEVARDNPKFNMIAEDAAGRAGGAAVTALQQRHAMMQVAEHPSANHRAHALGQIQPRGLDFGEPARVTPPTLPELGPLSLEEQRLLSLLENS